MKTILGASLLTCLTFAGQFAAAEEHEVLILRYGFYPETVYVSPGDTIKFINESPNWASVQSNDADDNYANYSGNCDAQTFAGSSDGWMTGWIAVNGSTTITVSECMDTTLMPPNVYNYTTYTGYNYGWITFGNAPTG